jgi:hypothetical protein
MIIFKNVKTGEYYENLNTDTNNIHNAKTSNLVSDIRITSIQGYEPIDFNIELNRLRKEKLNSL